MQAVIVLDVGTTGVKAALMDRTGRTLAQDYRDYPMSVQEERVEQDPEDWWRGSVAVLSSVAARAEPARVAALCLGGQMQDLITLGGHGAIGKAILYSDMRARKEAGLVEEALGAVKLQERTGNIQDASSLLAKILWLRGHEPRRYGDARKLLFGAHDYISWRLTGSEAVDLTTLSTTGLLAIASSAYAFDLIDAIGFDRQLFPEAVSADHFDGGLREDAARLIGVPAGTPVFHGSGDAGCTTVGAGAGVPGTLSCYLGTSGWLAGTTAGALADPRTGIFNLRHPDPSALIHVGPMLLAAGTVDWAIESFGVGTAAGDRYESFTREAASATPGSGDLFFLPYLVGERSPFRDPAARGAFIGLSRSTTRADLSRAVLEGVAFAMKSIHEAMRAEGDNAAQSLSLSGGGARSSLWPQVFSDVFGCEVRVAEKAAVAGLVGSFVIASRALGWLDGWTPPRESLGAVTVFRPDPQNHRAYERSYDVFRGLYPALRGSFAAVSNLGSVDRSGTGCDISRSTRRDR